MSPSPEREGADGASTSLLDLQEVVSCARAGARQRVCSAAACQRERHRQSCRRWHGNNPDYDREDRLRRRLLRDPPEQAIPEILNRPPMVGLDREAARDAVGLEVIVLLEVAAQLLWDGVRDAVRPQVAVGQSVGTKVLPGRARDEIGGAGDAP